MDISLGNKYEFQNQSNLVSNDEQEIFDIFDHVQIEPNDVTPEHIRPETYDEIAVPMDQEIANVRFLELQ